MAGKRNLKSWFMKNIVLPNNETIDKPGFIIYQFQARERNAFMREILFPEKMLAAIEVEAHRAQGKKADRALYRAGKRWGYRFADGALFPELAETDKKTVKAFYRDFIKFCETVYSGGFSGSMDLARKEIRLEGRDVIICTLSGHGEVFLGAWVGVWGHTHGDRGIEGTHPECQGRGDPRCVFVCAPGKRLGIKVPVIDGSASHIEPQFYKLNTPHDVASDWSLQRFLEIGNISYDGGFFRIGDDRLVLHESSSIYFIEHELKRIEAGGVVFDAAFEYFKEFSRWHTLDFLISFLMATGWGEVKVMKKGRRYTAVVRNFPWTSLASEIDFEMVAGAFSGFLSGMEKRRVILRKRKADLLHGYLQLTFGS